MVTNNVTFVQGSQWLLY